MYSRLMILLNMVAVGFLVYAQSWHWAAVAFCGFQASCTYLVVETLMLKGVNKRAN